MRDKRILIVEDNSLYGELVRIWLHESIYGFVVVDSAAEAIEELKIGGYNLVVSDLFMPDMSGVMLEEIVREQFKVPFVIVTANSTFEVPYYKFENKYQKPVTKEAFISIVEKHIQ